MKGLILSGGKITDAIQDLIDRGLTVRPHIVDGWWKDAGKQERAYVPDSGRAECVPVHAGRQFRSPHQVVT